MLGYYDELTYTFILYPFFEGPLTDFPEKTKIIIFEEDAKNHTFSNFNQSVANKLPKNLTHLTFGRYFNQPINKGSLPPTITYLTFGYYFNQRANYLPPAIIHLTFGHDFNHPVDVLPSNITHLTFGYSFNQYVDKLPKSLTHLKFGNSFNQPANKLPKSLTHLTFGYEFNQPKVNLPDSLIYLGFSASHPINNIPLNVSTVKISFDYYDAYNHNVENLPSSVKKIIVNDITKIGFIKKIPFGCEIVEEK